MSTAESSPPGTESTRKALCEAIDDEYHARATYGRVIEAFGPVPPFTNILASEERHIVALMRQFRRFGWQPPADRWAGAVPAPGSLAEACRIGMEAEIANAALYQRIMTMTDDAEVMRVFDNLRRASQERHLAAFRRCVERGTGASGSGGCGRGGRRRGGCDRAPPPAS